MATGGNLLQNILDQAGSDIENAGSTVLNYLNQSKTRAKQNGAISQSPMGQNVGNSVQNSVSNFKTSPLYDLLSGNISKIPGQIASDTSNLNNQGKQGNMGPLMGMLGVDTAMPQDTGVSSLNNILNRSKNSPVRISLNPSVYGAGREAAVQKTVDTIVPGKTAIEKYNNLQPTMANLGDQITKIMKTNPKVTNLDQIMQDYDKNLQNEGVYRTSGIPKDQVQKAARGYLSDLQNEAIQESGGSINPTQISDAGILNLKQKVNQDFKSVQKKIDNGTSLSDRDKVIGAARQTLDDTLTTLHPEVKQLTMQQSHLYDAADSLHKATQQEFKNLASQPGFLGKLANATIKNPTFDLVAALAGGHSVAGAFGNLATAGEVGASNFLNFVNSKIHGQANPENEPNGSPGQGNNQNGQVVHGPNITSSTNNVNNRYTMTDPIQSGIFMNPSDYAKQIGDLQQKMGQEKLGNPQAFNTDNGTLQALQAKYQAQQPLRDTWVGTANQPGVSQILTVGNTAFDSINKADPGFFNALNGGYDKLQTASNGKYAQMAKYLQYLGSATGQDFTQYKSKDALINALDASMATVKNQWIQQVQGYSGTSANVNGIPQGPAGQRGGVQNQQAASPKMPPASFDFGGPIQ